MCSCAFIYVTLYHVSEKDSCHPNPCVNGKCVSTSDGFVCRCALGFKGEKCAGKIKDKFLQLFVTEIVIET